MQLFSLIFLFLLVGIYHFTRASFSEHYGHVQNSIRHLVHAEHSAEKQHFDKFPVLMPNVQPKYNDTYLCTAIRLPRSYTLNIVGAEINANTETVHHVQLAGCEVPGYTDLRENRNPVWECDEYLTGHDQLPRCHKGAQHLFVAKPEEPGSGDYNLLVGVVYKVGGNTGINYLVLQIHYANVNSFLAGTTDSSGMILSLLPNDAKDRKQVGILKLRYGDSGKDRILAHTTEHVEIACQMNEPLEIKPFAFRVHTHGLGIAVAGYKVNGHDRKWELIGKSDPRLPQIFHPVKNPSMLISKGDIVAARCTINNTLDHDVHQGGAFQDEMCGFYIMYTTSGGDRTLDMKYCVKPGPPLYYWRMDERLTPIPEDIDIDASMN